MSIERRVLELMQEYRRSNSKVTVRGKTYYIKEGDLLLDEEALRLYAEEQAQAEQERSRPPEGISRLKLVADPSGRAVRWRKGLVLTYTVRRRPKADDFAAFESDEEYEAVVDAMFSATSEWENACGINFKHLQEQDELSSAVDDRGPKPLFEVVKHDYDGSIVASAFFPNTPPQERQVIIFSAFFSTDLWFPQVGVLRHELGHVLGFRHEHIDPDAPKECQGEIPGRVIDATIYDPKSVMHYFCGGVGSMTLEITDLDRAASSRLYGPPDCEVSYWE